jgi:hypothetical protein
VRIATARIQRGIGGRIAGGTAAGLARLQIMLNHGEENKVGRGIEIKLKFCVFKHKHNKVCSSLSFKSLCHALQNKFPCLLEKRDRSVNAQMDDL